MTAVNTFKNLFGGNEGIYNIYMFVYMYIHVYIYIYIYIET
jgi:hypothetical protein